MTQHLDHRCGDVGRPHRDGAVVVTQAQDSVVRVLAHDAAAAQARPVLRNDLACAGVLVVQHSCRGQQQCRSAVSTQRNQGGQYVCVLC